MGFWLKLGAECGQEALPKSGVGDEGLAKPKRELKLACVEAEGGRLIAERESSVAIGGYPVAVVLPDFPDAVSGAFQATAEPRLERLPESLESLERPPPALHGSQVHPRVPNPVAPCMLAVGHAPKLEMDSP